MHNVLSYIHTSIRTYFTFTGENEHIPSLHLTSVSSTIFNTVLFMVVTDSICSNGEQNNTSNLVVNGGGGGGGGNIMERIALLRVCRAF